jgi:hypothetical protein
MTDIRVRSIDIGESRSTFEVRLTDGASSSIHQVTAATHDVERLGARYETPESFIEACFAFLLARESKEQILSSFDVAVIATYFPEFERTITGR